MNASEDLGDPAKLREWLDRLGDFPGEGWLVIRTSVDEPTLDMHCWPLVDRIGKMAQEELEALSQAGYRDFLSDELLEDIVSNLRQQNEDFVESQLEAAIQFYWKNDAFIVLSTAYCAAAEGQSAARLF